VEEVGEHGDGNGIRTSCGARVFGASVFSPSSLAMSMVVWCGHLTKKNDNKKSRKKYLHLSCFVQGFCWYKLQRFLAQKHIHLSYNKVLNLFQFIIRVNF
jgi:hypothetical protein